MKIIDGFIFYNELDMLSYRLNTLKNVVDYFILVESTHTFVGKEKPLIFQMNQHLFEEFKAKIIHIVVKDFPHKYPQIQFKNQEQWANEYHQRSAIMRGFEKIKYTDEDILIIADVDEIPDRDTLLKIKNRQIPVKLNTLEMDFYYYNLHSRLLEKWDRCRVFSSKTYKETNRTFQELRDLKPEKFSSEHTCDIQNGGWHLSYFGDSSFIQNKIMQFAHQEFNNESYTDMQKIEERMQNSIDIYNRPDCYIQKIPLSENTFLPPQHEIYLTKFY